MNQEFCVHLRSDPRISKPFVYFNKGIFPLTHILELCSNFTNSFTKCERSWATVTAGGQISCLFVIAFPPGVEGVTMPSPKGGIIFLTAKKSAESSHSKGGFKKREVFLKCEDLKVYKRGIHCFHIGSK
jgi:hypothetical protein